MAKSTVSEWDVVADNNTRINGINIDENCPPSAINNAIREVMAQVKQWKDGYTDSLTGEKVYQSLTVDDIDVKGVIKVNNTAGVNGQAMISKGSSASPMWTTLGTMSSQNYDAVNITGGSVRTTGDLNVIGSLKLNNSVGGNGQVLKSVGSTLTPVWSTLGTMSAQDSNAVNITGGSITTTGTLKTNGDLNVTGLLKLDNSVGSSGQVLKSVGSTNTPTWATLGNMSNQYSNAVNITGGKITGTTINGHTVGSNSTGTKYVSTGNPSGGSDGDIWYKI